MRRCWRLAGRPTRPTLQPPSSGARLQLRPLFVQSLLQMTATQLQQQQGGKQRLLQCCSAHRSCMCRLMAGSGVRRSRGVNRNAAQQVPSDLQHRMPHTRRQHENPDTCGDLVMHEARAAWEPLPGRQMIKHYAMLPPGSQDHVTIVSSVCDCPVIARRICWRSLRLQWGPPWTFPHRLHRARLLFSGSCGLSSLTDAAAEWRELPASCCQRCLCR